MPLRKVRRVLVVGAGAFARATVEDLRRDEGVELIGALALPGEAVHPHLGAPVVGGVHAVLEHLTKRTVDEVYLAADVVKHHAALQEVLRTCERLGTAFALPASPFRLEVAEPVGRAARGDGFLHYETDPSHPVQDALKRATDLVGSGVALLLLAPVFLAVAAAITIEDPGPVFFPQLRVGRNGRMFRMLKFRSMVVNAEAKQQALLATNEQTGPVFKMRHDPRITRTGRFIRRFSIDELPQFWNVFVGDMSLVGPRPPLHREVEQYEPWQRRRLSVRPGITCLWQVSGRNSIGFTEWMHLDLQYIAQRSFATDLRLLAKTIPAVVTGSNAS